MARGPAKVESSELFSTPDNPVPAGAETGLLDMEGGVKLRHARWEPTVPPCRGTVVILHGRTEFIEKYFETIGDFRDRGFAVFTFDWRGQGGSTRLLGDRKKGHVEHFDDYLDDLEAMLTRIVMPDCRPPYYLFGHSTGALTALLAAPALGNRIDRIVLSSPLLQINQLPVRQVALQRLLGMLTYLGFGRSYVPGTPRHVRGVDFEGNLLTSDKDRMDRNKSIVAAHQHLGLAGPTIAWLFAACRAMAQVLERGYAASISVPTLFVLPGSDRVVASTVAEKLALTMRSGSSIVISGARHELLQERDIYREQALAAFDTFVPGRDIESERRVQSAD